MLFLKKDIFSAIRALFIWSAVFFFYSDTFSKPIVFGTGDSLATSVNPNFSFVYQKNNIQKMNKEQLTSLVDYLFEMDTVPLGLLDELTLAIANLKGVESNTVPGKSTENSSFPAADLYVSWEINSLFPEKDMLKMKGDTSVTIDLQGLGHSNFVNPFNGPVTSNFGWRDSTLHKGIDIDLKKGDQILSAFDGMVRVARNYGGFGNVVIIRHYNGLETVYAHLSKIKVKSSQLISAGQLIGLGGSTGHATGSHLHFEVRFKGVPINPKYVILFPEQKLICEELVIKKTKWGLAAFPKDVKYYTIEKGDTLFDIAKRFGTTTASIKEMNGLSGRVRLKAGQKLNVAQ